MFDQARKHGLRSVVRKEWGLIGAYAGTAGAVGAGLAGYGVGMFVHEGLDRLFAFCVPRASGPSVPRDPGYSQPPQQPTIPSDAGVGPSGTGDSSSPADPSDAGAP